MDHKDLVDEWSELDAQIKALVRRQETIEKTLKVHPAGSELEGHVTRVRVCDRAVLNSDQLEQHVTPSMWRRITKRVVVADLLKAEVRRGKIDSDVVETCQTRSQKWLKTIM